jgi:hypothetical protein
VPEAVDVGRGLFAEYGGRDAFRGEDPKAPGEAAEPDQSRDHAWDDGQDQALEEGETGAGSGGHVLILAEIAELAELALNSANPANSAFQLYRSQRMSSGMVARLPYMRIPTR